jgi:hypothetical protein
MMNFGALPKPMGMAKPGKPKKPAKGKATPSKKQAERGYAKMGSAK